MHNVVPNAKAYIAVLQRKTLQRGVELLLKHRAARLVQADGGRVIGVEVQRADGSSASLRARKGVILAAGELLQRGRD